MANNFVKVQPSATGTNLQTFENTVGGNVVDAEAVTLVRSSDNTEVGTAGQPVRVDPTGTTVQPISAASLPLPTGAATDASVTNSQVTPGTIAETKVTIVGGKTNDGTPQYREIPEGAGGRSVIVEGIAGGTKVPVDGSGVTQPVSIAATLPVQIVGSGTLLSGQQAVTASAVALTSNACKAVTVKALVGNTINVYVGPSGITTGTGYELAPGDTISFPITNTNLIFVIASTTGASVSWLATS